MIWNFNPHSHKGSDENNKEKHTWDIHFNPHSHKGSDEKDSEAFRLITNFNPHSHKGSDALSFPQHVLPLEFQSTLPQGE